MLGAGRPPMRLRRGRGGANISLRVRVRGRRRPIRRGGAYSEIPPVRSAELATKAVEIGNLAVGVWEDCALQAGRRGRGGTVRWGASFRLPAGMAAWG